VDLIAPVRRFEGGLERLRVWRARAAAGGLRPQDGDGDENDDGGEADQNAPSGPPGPFGQRRHQGAPVRFARTKPQKAAKPPSAMWGSLARSMKPIGRLCTP